MNPRAGATDLLVFEARPFSHLGTPPDNPVSAMADKNANYCIIH